MSSRVYTWRSNKIASSIYSSQWQKNNYFIRISTTFVVYPTFSIARFTSCKIWFFCLKICILSAWLFVFRKKTLNLTNHSNANHSSRVTRHWEIKKFFMVFNATAPTIWLPICLWANVFLNESLSDFIN